MKNQIQVIIFNCIEKLNYDLDEEQQLELSTGTILFGKNGKIDSMTLVKLIVTIEDKLREKLNVSITLVDEKAFTLKNSPFRTVHSLIDYIVRLLEEDSK
jgi:acyl carrier protein